MRLFTICFFVFFVSGHIAGQEAVKYLEQATHLYRTNPDSARYYALEALKIAKKVQSADFQARSNILIGLTYHISGDFTEGYTYFYNAMLLFDSINNKAGYAQSLNLIGSVYRKQGENDQALRYYQQAIAIERELRNPIGISKNLNNIGDIYRNLKQYDEALRHYEQSLSIDLENAYEEGMADNYNNMGDIFRKKNDFQKAISFYNKSLEIASKLDLNLDIAENLSSIGACYEKLGEDEKSLEYLQQSLFICQKYGFIDEEVDALKAIGDTYKRIKQFEKALEYNIAFQKVSDSVFRKVNIETIAEMQSKYEADKKDKEIALQNAQLKEQSLTRDLLIIGMAGVFIIALISFYSYRHQRKKSKIVTEQRNLLIEKNTAINLQNEEILAQRDKILQQRDFLEKQHNEIESSIRYAETIQTAVLPLLKDIQEHFDIFLLYHPKEIVSGDFYWFEKVYDRKNEMEYIFAAVVDCTGHGVPGAFMSLIGAWLLHDIVRIQNIYSPAEIIVNLNQRLQETLKQKQSNNEDGMDVCLCRITVNKKKCELVFAGAQRPLYYYDSQEDKLIRIKGDDMFIGGSFHLVDNSFHNHELKLAKNDVIYLTTDGYVDQNNAENKRLGSKEFAKKLKQIASKNMDKQQQILEDFLEEYRNNQPFRDDITILGLRFS